MNKFQEAEERHARYVKQQQETAQPHDWPEDFAHENGMYFNECRNCHVHFVGYKRRILCRLCAPPDRAV